MRGASASKLPEVFQTTPRKVNFSQGQIMAVSPVENGRLSLRFIDITVYGFGVFYQFNIVMTSLI